MKKADIKKLSDHIQRILTQGPEEAGKMDPHGYYPFLVGWYESSLKNLKQMLDDHLTP